MDIIERLNKELLDKYYEKLNELNSKKVSAYDDLRSREVTDEEKEEINEIIEDELQKLYKKVEEREKKGKRPLTIEDIDKERRQTVARIINKKIEETNQKIREEKNKYKSEVERIKEIIDLLKKDSIDLDKVYSILKKTILSSEEKADYMKDISMYAEIKNKEYAARKQKEEQERIALEEKKKEEEAKKVEVVEEKINNIEYIESAIQKHSDLITNIDSRTLEGLFSESDLNQIINMYFVDLDDEIFNSAIETLLFNITEKADKNEIQKILDNIDKLCKKYELLSNLSDLEDLIKDVYARFNVTGDEVILLSKIQNEIAKVKNNNFDENKVGEVIDETYSKIYEIRKQKYSKYINSGDKLTTKAFILFDYEKTKKQNVPYILSDLNEKTSENKIDEAIKKEKIVSNGYNDFNDLIDELIMYGAPQITLQKNDKMNKLIRPIYYHDSVYDNIKTSMKNATGMVRIRPRLSSYLRFIDEKIVFAPKTEKMKQIKELLEDRLPNISIDENRSFILFINYLDAFKLKDTDSYVTSLKRKETSELRKILKNNNDKYSDEELYKIGKAIDMTLEAYQTLKDINSNFNFDVVDKLQNNDQIISLD